MDPAATRPIEFSVDGRELYWLDSRGRDTAAVVAQDLASGTTSATSTPPGYLEDQCRRPIVVLAGIHRVHLLV